MKITRLRSTPRVLATAFCLVAVAGLPAIVAEPALPPPQAAPETEPAPLATPGGFLSGMTPEMARRYGLAMPSPAPKPPRFDLDFKGGSPGMLVEILSKAALHPINAIIPDEGNDVQIPPMSLKRVTVESVFEAVSMASQANSRASNQRSRPFGGGGEPAPTQLTYGFRRATGDDESPVWVFYFQKPAVEERIPPTKSVRFFQLAPYLDGPDGLKVEDITTAIRTGYDLLGAKDTPEFKFHKETRLLIAVGEQSRLALIDEVLNSLPRGDSVEIDPTTGLPVPRQVRLPPASNASPKRP